MATLTAPSATADTRAGTWPTRAMLGAFVRLSRFKFLIESLLTGTLGVAIALNAGFRLQVSTWILVQAFISGTHLMTHYCNEYFDYEADVAQKSPTGWTGGSRVLAQGELSRETSLAAAFVSLFAVLGLAVAMPDGTARVLALVIVGLAWFYTAPPFRLNYCRLGEVTTSVVLMVLTPLLACYTQAHMAPTLLFAIGVPLFLVMVARMAVMNAVDRDADILVAKHTLATAAGARGTGVLFAVAQVLAYGTVGALTGLRLIPLVVGILFWATVPLAWVTARRLLGHGLRDTASAERTAYLATMHVGAIGYAVCAGLVAVTAWSRLSDPALAVSVWMIIGVLAAYTALQGVLQVRS
jgi:1,4-dihydroxy-2-naphthoate octaprenyltransferase